MAAVREVARDLAADSRLLRVVWAWFLYAITEHGVWIALLAYAYGRGGASESGLVALVQLAPAALGAPLLATIADRHSPSLLLIGGYLTQTMGMALVSVCMYAEAPALLTYAFATVMTVGFATTRPAHATLTPALARDAQALMAANVAYGWLDSLGLVVGSLLTAAGLALGSAALVFAISAGLGLGQVLLVMTIRVAPIATATVGTSSALAAVAEGFRGLAANSRARLLVGLIGAVYVVIGALDVIFVVVAVGVLAEGASWVGYLSAGFGVGGVLAGLLSTRLIGRQLSRPILLAIVAIAASVALVAASQSAGLTLALFVVAGTGKAVLLVATQSLLQRVVPADLLGRIFGVVEGMLSLGLAIGSLVVPVLVAVGGNTTALIGVALVLPLTALLAGRAMVSLDAGAAVPVVEIALLRSMRHFAALPVPSLEGLAAALRPIELADEEVLMHQGQAGDDFYVVAAGRLAIWVDGERVATRGRGTGIGEIALLHGGTRTATVTAQGSTQLFALDGAAFLATVTGHPATYQRAHEVVREYLEE